MFLNREEFIAEHLTNQNPTLFTLQKDLDDANEEIKAVKDNVESMKQQGMAQSGQAAGALASLQAIPGGSANTIIPTR